jgi:Holliday junction resolvasome RuvABC endonuclease subunit
MIHIGIDPGATGGVAAITTAGVVWRLDKMPATDVDILALLEAVTEGGIQPAHAVLERVQAWKGGPMGAWSAFKFGSSYGALQMALAACRIPFDLVQPQRWQAALGCLSGGKKNVTKRRAQALFPGVTITHATADALLMAEFCRRMRSGIDG